jgi:hypothetical protein
MGAFEGERREQYKHPADAGTICRPKWINQGIKETVKSTKERFDGLFLSETSSEKRERIQRK